MTLLMEFAWAGMVIGIVALMIIANVVFSKREAQESRNRDVGPPDYY